MLKLFECKIPLLISTNGGVMSEDRSGFSWPMAAVIIVLILVGGCYFMQTNMQNQAQKTQQLQAEQAKTFFNDTSSK